MDKKYQIMALIGESGAGKDTVQQSICTMHPLIFHPIVSCTTRPCRENEVDGCDYNFIALEDFTKKLLHGEMLEASEFRNWFYGTPISALSTDKINIGVFNPAGICSLLKDPRVEVIVCKVECDDKTRLMRSLNREEHPDCAEICRRYFTDKEDFENLDFSYFIISNYDENIQDDYVMINSLSTELEAMWERLDTKTGFETIARWESSMSIKAESDKDKDKDD